MSEISAANRPLIPSQPLRCGLYSGAMNPKCPIQPTQRLRFGGAASGSACIASRRLRGCLRAWVGTLAMALVCTAHATSAGNGQPQGRKANSAQAAALPYDGSGVLSPALIARIQSLALAGRSSQGAMAETDTATPAAPLVPRPDEARATTSSSDAAQRIKGLRIEVEVGSPDPRLRLAACARTEAYIPSNSTLWGRSRVGLRCLEGATAWNIFLPVTVRAWGPALVAAIPLPLGRQLQAGDFAQAEIDWAENPSAAVFDLAQVVGRTLSRAMAPGESLRLTHLRPRQWFAAGDLVRIRAVGDGFAIAGTAEAVTAGIEGQPARVRTESGRILTGDPVGERQMEIGL
jgi:flagella basal body P-ring formation protein FlgA